MELRNLSKKRRRIELDSSGFVILRIQNPPSPLIFTTTASDSIIHLKSDSLYTIGRCNRYCDFVYKDSRISNRHCQILLDSNQNRLFIIDGFVNNCYSSSEIGEFFRLRKCNNKEGCTRASTNGVFVNGIRVKKGCVFEIFVGDSVSFVKTGSILEPSFCILVEKIVCKEDALCRNQIVYGGCSTSSSCKWLLEERQKTIGGGFGFGRRWRNENLIDRAVFLLNQCRETLHSVDPVAHLRRCCMVLSNEREMARMENGHPHCSAVVCGFPDTDVVGSGLRCDAVKVVCRDNGSDLDLKTGLKVLGSSSGKKFYLNRIKYVDHDAASNQHEVVSLPELLHPVASLLRVFIATFTNDVLWFLSCCEVPTHLPITIACHNTERCWSSDLDKRTSAPYPEYPNLVLVYPQFPEVIAFGKDRTKQGIACHHPKLLVLQREDSIRVVVTSANLVSKQWNDVTNTVWWQDFPRRSEADYSSLFTQFTDGGKSFKSDFAAQLAGFVASLLSDVPSQAQWIAELAKYDFSGAVGHLVASVPGMHKHKNPYPLEPMNFLSAKHCSSRSFGTKFLGSVEASVVGLKYRFHTSADSNGAQLKTLAAFLRRCQENAFGMSEVLLRRNTNIPADSNAVSVLICDLDEASEGDCVQLGFLPRNIANFVAPLCDSGLFSFTACIYPKEALAAALEGSNSKVQLILYVAQGPKFHEISTLIKPVHVAAICSLLASVQRCSGIWRLREVLDQYKWPELLETDFIYGSSSIGTSIDPKFLAAFAGAAGKRSPQYADSEESDPEVACFVPGGVWNANQEARNPSMRILFPTIQRVKDAPCGIWPSRRLLCFSEKTWQRLRTVDMLRDSIPHPKCRVGYPMHVKVARRRFRSKSGKSSFGWVYCGSHNFSPAAWGRPVAAPSAERTDKSAGTTSCQSSRLHICNYELGIIFVVPPSDKNSKSTDLDDIVLPFVVPAPKYRHCDRPATAKAMRDALAELGELEKKNIENQAGEEVEETMTLMEDEVPEEEEVVEINYVPEEKDEEKAYAKTLWSQVDSSEG